jgi:Transglycosylase SLT domain
MPTVADLITQEAQRQGVDPSLAIEVANAESGLDPNVGDSSAGAIGVFQLEPATAAGLGVNPRDLTQNIRGGVTYLGQLLAQFGGVPAALAAYNWGPGHLSQAIAQWGTDWVKHLPAETAAYISKIVRNLSQYRTMVTPSSIANGVTQLVAANLPAPDATAAGATADGGPVGPAPPAVPSGSLTGILIFAGIAVGVYILAEVIND